MGLGWEWLQAKRNKHKLTTFYNMHDLAPPYLSDLIPPIVGQTNNYALRNADQIAQRYCNAESTICHLAGEATIINLFCWVPCQEFVLISYDHIAYVMSSMSVHITDVYRL